MDQVFRVNQHYLRIFHGKKFICNIDVGNLPMKYEPVGNNNPYVISTNTSQYVIPRNNSPYVIIMI